MLVFLFCGDSDRGVLDSIARLASVRCLVAVLCLRGFSCLLCRAYLRGSAPALCPACFRCSVCLHAFLLAWPLAWSLGRLVARFSHSLACCTLLGWLDQPQPGHP